MLQLDTELELTPSEQTLRGWSEAAFRYAVAIQRLKPVEAAAWRDHGAALQRAAMTKLRAQ